MRNAFPIVGTNSNNKVMCKSKLRLFCLFVLLGKTKTSTWICVFDMSSFRRQTCKGDRLGICQGDKLVTIHLASSWSFQGWLKLLNYLLRKGELSPTQHTSFLLFSFCSTDSYFSCLHDGCWCWLWNVTKILYSE